MVEWKLPTSRRFYSSSHGRSYRLNGLSAIKFTVIEKENIPASSEGNGLILIASGWKSVDLKPLRAWESIDW